MMKHDKKRIGDTKKTNSMQITVLRRREKMNMKSKTMIMIMNMMGRKRRRWWRKGRKIW